MTTRYTPNVPIKKDDTFPYLEVALQSDDGRPINLTGATVRFAMRDLEGAVKVSARLAQILSHTRGEVRHVWGPSDTDTAGVYQGEFTVTTAGGEVQRFPTEGFILIHVVDNVE